MRSFPTVAVVFALLALAGPAHAAATTDPTVEAKRGASLSAGDSHTCAVARSTRLWCWGESDDGRIGRPPAAGDVGDDEPVSATEPVRISADESVRAIQVSSGRAHTCAVLSDRTLRCFGDNAHGQLGRGSTTDVTDPLSVPPVDIEPVAQVAAGRRHTCALLVSGDVRCWGDNGEGQTGLGRQETIGDDPGETPRSVPVVALGGRRAVALSANDAHTCATLEDGAVRCFGDNNGAKGRIGLPGVLRLGRAETPDTASPVSLDGGAVSVAVGEQHSCATMTTGRLRCFGNNAVGAIGLPGRADLGFSEAPSAAGPVALGDDRAPLWVSGGQFHSCVALRSGAVRCWGAAGARLGQNVQGVVIGDDETPGSVPPVAVDAAGTAAVATAAGGRHSCALLVTGRLRCWGAAESGQTGHDSTTQYGGASLATVADAPDVTLGEPTIGRVADLELTAPPVVTATVGGTATVEVTVGNTGPDGTTALIELDGPLGKQNLPVDLLPSGASRTLSATFATPAAGSFPMHAAVVQQAEYDYDSRPDRRGPSEDDEATTTVEAATPPVAPAPVPTPTATAPPGVPAPPAGGSSAPPRPRLTLGGPTRRDARRFVVSARLTGHRSCSGTVRFTILRGGRQLVRGTARLRRSSSRCEARRTLTLRRALRGRARLELRAAAPAVPGRAATSAKRSRTVR